MKRRPSDVDVPNLGAKAREMRLRFLENKRKGPSPCLIV